MKKFLVVLSALIVAAACSAPPTNREASPAANANVATAPSAPAVTEADAIAKEKAIWETLKNKDYDAFAAMLDTEQVEVRPEGVMDKNGSINGVKGFEPSEVNFSDWKYLLIDKDAFVVTYSASYKGKFQGKDFPEEKVRASSAWVNRQGKWLAFYHQESPLMPPPPPPKATPAASPAKPGASPAEAPAAPAAPPATGADPIANEKIVWDLFKSKNFDAFADLLVPEFIEVEAEGVYDRAGSIQGLQRLDVSKVVLDDWKAGRIDDDASLVTYTIKGPTAPFTRQGERHATIWVKRNGKWYGLLHHGGTPVRPAPPPPPAAKKTPSPAASQ